MLTSSSDSDIERSNISFNENKLDGNDDLTLMVLTTAFERTEKKAESTMEPISDKHFRAI